MVNPVRGVRALADFFDTTTRSWRFPWRDVDDMLEVGLDEFTGYSGRTRRNASQSDITIHIAKDFNTPGEQLTARSTREASRPIIQVPHEAEDFDEQVRRTVEALNEAAEQKQGPLVINGAGNATNSLGSQEAADDFAMRFLTAVLESSDRRFEISTLRSGGQTGYDAALIKAALGNGIRARIVAARGRGTGGFLIRRVDGRDYELGVEEYIDELDIYEDSIQAIVDKFRGRVPAVSRSAILQPEQLRREVLSKPDDFVYHVTDIDSAATRDLEATWPTFSGGLTGDIDFVRGMLNNPAYLDVEDPSQLVVVAWKKSDLPEEILRQIENGDIHNFRTLMDPEVSARLDELLASGMTRKDALNELGWTMTEDFSETGRFTPPTFFESNMPQPVGILSAEDARTVYINLDRMSEADIEQTRRQIAVRTARVDQQTGRVDQLDAALAEESARQLGITEAELARAAKEKNKLMRIRAREEARRRRALEGLARGRGMGAAASDITIEDIARHVPELLDPRTYLHMEDQRAQQEIEGTIKFLFDKYVKFNPLTTPAAKIPTHMKLNVQTLLDNDDFVSYVTSRQFLTEELGIDFKAYVQLQNEKKRLAAIKKKTEKNKRQIKSNKEDIKMWEESFKLKGFVFDKDGSIKFEPTWDSGNSIVRRVAESRRTPQEIRALINPSRLYASMEAMDDHFPLTNVSGATIRIVDPAMFPGATPQELEWLSNEGIDAARTLIQVIGGNFTDPTDKELMIRIARRASRKLRRIQGDAKPNEAIDQFFKDLYYDAVNATTRYDMLVRPRDFDPEIGRADIDALYTGLELDPAQRVLTSLVDRNGVAHQVSFAYDGSYDLRIRPAAIEIDGKPASLDALESLLEANAERFDIRDNPMNFWYFSLGDRATNALAKRFSNSGIRIQRNGEDLALHEAFILDVLGWRQAGMRPGRDVHVFLMDLLTEMKTVPGKKKGETVKRRVARDKPLPLTPPLPMMGVGARTEAIEFWDDYVDLIMQNVEYEELASLASLIGRRSLRSSSPLQAWGPDLTPEYALTHILDVTGLRPTRALIDKPPRPVIQPDPVAMPQAAPATDAEVFHVYSPGELIELPREIAESTLGVKRFDMPERGLLNMLGIDRPHADRIVRRNVVGRKARPKREVTEAQRKGILEQKTPEERELAKMKATDEYGFSVLEVERDVVDILRKPGTQRHFGNPYPVDDSGNSAQVVWANQKFEHYFLHGGAVETWNNAAGRMMVFDNAAWMRRNFWRLRGKKLACVCRGQYCHGEILLRYAESPDIGILIERYGDDPELMGQMAAEWLTRTSPGSGEWARHLQALESFLGDSLTAMPTTVNLRVQVGDLFMDRVTPKPGTLSAPGSFESSIVTAERVLE